MRRGPSYDTPHLTMSLAQKDGLLSVDLDFPARVDLPSNKVPRSLCPCWFVRMLCDECAAADLLSCQPLTQGSAFFDFRPSLTYPSETPLVGDDVHFDFPNLYWDPSGVK